MAIYMPSDLEKRSELLAWAEARLPYVRSGFDRAKATPVGIVRAGDLVAVAIYHQRRAASVEFSVAATTPRWASPQVIAALMAFAFSLPGVRRVEAIVAARNKRSRRLTAGVGFVLEGKKRCYFPDDDGFVYGLTRADFERSRWRLLVAQPEARAA